MLSNVDPAGEGCEWEIVRACGTSPLSQRLWERLRGGQPCSFAEMMALGLYDEDHGYYRQHLRVGGRDPVGRGGDFLTSVSVGGCFGSLLARHVIAVWEEMGRPREFILIEQGAHDGQLMEDIVVELRVLCPELGELARAITVDPDPVARARQGERLGGLIDHKAVASVHEARGGAGLFFANELIDALPVCRVRMQGGRWRELFVVAEEDGRLALEPGELSTVGLERELERIDGLWGEGFPEGYETEIPVAMIDWVEELVSAGLGTALLLIDYGHLSADYYLPLRGEGTFRAVSGHREVVDYLAKLGECDLTAHVDFGRLAGALEDGGCSILGISDQGRFLVGLARREIESGARWGSSWRRQFQMLTHPGIMGARFLVLDGRLTAPG